jgi:K+-sensing histidine kinase KdpD
MARSNPLWPSAPGAILRYAVAVLAVAAAVVVGLLLDRFLQTAPTVSLFLCAVLFAAWFGGAGPGLLATGLSIVTFDYYFILPADSFAAQTAPRLVLFAVTALFVVWVSVARATICGRPFKSSKTSTNRCKPRTPNERKRNKAFAKPSESFR